MADGEPLGEIAPALEAGRRDPTDYVGTLYDRIASVEPDVRAWVDGPKLRAWSEAETAALLERHPDTGSRPPLFGVPVGVKDIVDVDGLPTRAGSDLPPGELAGPQATVVSRLRDAGAFVLGKTVTTEFAWMDPGPTRNPHDVAHTPGGSSSGSAAAVAAGTVPLALGTQTIGSVIRPAAFCGVVGFKPSYGRIPLDGVLPLSPSVDHLGLFTRDVAGMRAAAAVCLDDWRPLGDDRPSSDPDDRPSNAPNGRASNAPDGSASAAQDAPTLGVPEGPYLDRASDAGRTRFEKQVEDLAAAGYDVERVPAFEDFRSLEDRHGTLVAAEAAMAHDEWFETYGQRYALETAELIRTGRAVEVGSLAAGRRSRLECRESLTETMSREGIDVWVSPAAPGPAPEGIDSTGNPVMNLPWTHAGLPTVGLPAGRVDGLPVGLQCAGRFGADEQLLGWAEELAGELGE